MPKKVVCDYCEKGFNSTKISKHMKEIHGSTYRIKISRKKDSTSNRSLNTDSTSISSRKNGKITKRSLINDSTSNSKPE